MDNILEKIVANTRLEVSERKAIRSQREVEQEALAAMSRPVNAFADALRASSTGIIAEFKRKSPSLGWIKEEGRPDVIPASYERTGATAVSILTDNHFFGGSLSYISTARPTLSIPILRKDFVVDEYQLLEARAAGADVVLLIASCLDREECKRLAAFASSLSLEVLLEVHDEYETDYYCPGVTAVGVNNRNLKTFVTDIATSKRLSSYLPKEVALVSESGLSAPEHLIELREYGYCGFLMGESFMKKPDPAEALSKFIAQMSQSSQSSR